MAYQDQRSLLALMAAIEDRISIASSKTNEAINEWSDVFMEDTTKGLRPINDCREQRGLPRQQSRALLIEEASKPKAEPLIWQEYNDYPAPLVPYVDKALISDTEPSWNIDLCRKIIIGQDVFIKAIISYAIGVIIGFIIIGAFIMLLR